MSLTVEHVHEVTSTMEAANKLIKDGKTQLPFVLIADIQTAGRATAGRKWESPKTVGNLFMSLAVSEKMCPTAARPMLPLVVGISARAAVVAHVTKTAETLKASLSAAEYEALHVPKLIEKVQLKWPNDLLCAEHKVMGAIIEQEGAAIVIGIGINVVDFPVIEASSGRQATSLKAYFGEKLWTWTAAELGEATCKEIIEQLKSFDAAEQAKAYRAKVTKAFAEHMPLNIVMQKRVEGGARGAEVRPVSLNEWGHLTVKHVDSGKEETLVSEYLD